LEIETNPPKSQEESKFQEGNNSRGGDPSVSSEESKPAEKFQMPPELLQ